jgi:hypothetical protein
MREHVLKQLWGLPASHLVNLAWGLGRICNNGELPVDDQLFAQLAGVVFPRIHTLQIRWVRG